MLRSSRWPDNCMADDINFCVVCGIEESSAFGFCKKHYEIDWKPCECEEWKSGIWIHPDVESRRKSEIFECGTTVIDNSVQIQYHKKNQHKEYRQYCVACGKHSPEEAQKIQTHTQNKFWSYHNIPFQNRCDPCNVLLQEALSS